MTAPFVDPDTENKNEAHPLTLMVAPPSMIPKLCNKINIAALDNNSFMLILAYSESIESAYLIERVSIDMNMMKSLQATINKVIEDVENNAKKS